MGFFSKGLKNEFETAVVNEPSVFEPLKFYCILLKTVASFLSVGPLQTILRCMGTLSCLYTIFFFEREKTYVLP